LVLLVSLGLAGAVTGQEPVRVYTNADLEPLPPTERASPAVAETGPGWEFVIDFLAEQHARIDADRAYELDGAALDEAARRTDATSRPRYVLPLSYGYGPWGRDPGTCSRPKNATTARALPGPRDLVVPLHARRPLHAR
jgi:hypothetical protein